ncbi:MULTISPECIES: DUF2892 domain-containing protein [Flavobacteriaceae]|uniref:YgaP family membrane protein n=1 Tax=Flavobacteriaceae TaxID=49546 RepID=UPI0010AE2BAC|nr:MULTISPECIES: DUF2892 domain-containing protein [Flavobacteriaceae]NJB36490.1 DUF2892 domain-containing protein [Croceivirga sp. JEA036]TKD66989.1 DUF2892 domain-containing protein [Flavobacterium sp. ASW18X]
MNKNMGVVDRVYRVIVAVLVALFGYLEIIAGVFSIILMVLAAIFIITSIIGYCPVYSLFKVNTCKTKE